MNDNQDIGSCLSTPDSDTESFGSCATEPRTQSRGRKKRQSPRGDAATLIALIEREASLRRITLKAAAKELGCTYVYLHQLRSGKRDLSAVSTEIIDKCATFLRTSRIAVKLMSGVVHVSDWLPARLNEADALYGGFLRVLEHPNGRALAGVDFRALPIEVQRWMIQLFSAHTGTELLEPACGSSLLHAMEREAVNAEAELRKSLLQKRLPPKTDRRRSSASAAEPR